MSSNQTRPAPADVQDAQTLRRWYWLRVELAEIARRVGVPASGSKTEVADRLCAHFEGRALPASVARPGSRDLLPSELSPHVVLREGQRCTQRLRAWMQEQAGPAFTFDEPMRDAVRAGGLTLGGLVELWHATRDRAPSDIASQFELNRFARRWHTAHAKGTRSQMLAAWAEYRSRPRD